MPTVDQALIGLKAFIDVSGLSKDVGVYEQAVNKMVGLNKKLVQDTLKSASDSKGIFESIFDSISDIGNIAFGNIIASITSSLGSGLQELSSQVVDAVSVFQTLRIQLDTIAARDYADAFGVPVSEALKETSEQSKELLNWIREISITTPFSAESLGKTLALSKAFGFTTEEAKKLVLSVGDFTAGMNLGDDVLVRVIYSMGQMVSQGKAMNREIRELANAFVPVSRVYKLLAEESEISIAQVQEDLKSGAISAKQFVDAFTELAAKEYPDAMERASQTFSGIANNIKDLVQVLLGQSILGPLGDKIAADLANVLSSLLSPEIYNVADALGETILFTYERLSEVVGNTLVPAFQNFFQMLNIATPSAYSFAKSLFRIGANAYVLAEGFASAIGDVTEFVSGIQDYFNTSFGDLTENMYGWGHNIIAQFAKGMANAMSAVLSALLGIARTITKFLKPGSPPLLLPDLDLWGTEAMITYMEGWEAADFSSFNSIGNLLHDAIRSWEGFIPEETILQRILASTSSLAEVSEEFRKFGEISSEALEQVMFAAGFASDEFEQLIHKTLEYQSLAEIQSAVSDLADFKQGISTDIFGITVDSFEEIIALSGRFGSELNTLVRQYAEGSEELIAVTKELTDAQNALNETTDHYDQILKDLEAQLNKVTDRQEDISRVEVIDETLASTILTARERERLELEKQQILLERQIRDTRLEKEVKVDAANSAIDGLKEQQQLLKDTTKEQLDQLKDISKANAERTKGQMKALEELIKQQIELNKLMGDMLNLKEAAKRGAEETALAFGTELETSMEDIIDGIDIQKTLQKLWDDILAETRKFWEEEVVAPFEPLIKMWEKVKTEFIDIINDPEFQKSWDEFVATINSGLFNLQIFWSQYGTELTEGLGELLGVIVTHLLISTDDTGKSVLQILADGFLDFTENMLAHKDDVLEMMDSIKDFLNDEGFPKLKEILAFLVSDALPAIVNFAINAVPPIMNLLGYLVSNSSTLLPLLLALAGAQTVKRKVGEGVMGIAGTALSVGGILKLLGVSGLGGAGATVAGTATTAAGSGWVMPAGLARNALGQFVSTGAGTAAATGAGTTAATGGAAALTGATVAAVAVPLALIAALVTLAFVVDKHGEAALGSLKMIGTILGIKTDETKVAIVDKLNEWFGEEGEIRLKFVDFGDDVDEYITGIADSFSSAFGEEARAEFAGNFQIAFDDAGTIMEAFFGEENGTLTGFLATGTLSVANFFIDLFGPEGTATVGMNEALISFDEWLGDIFGLEGKFTEWIAEAVAESVSWVADFTDIGKKMIDGFFEGMKTQKDTVWGNIYEWFNGLITTISSIFQTESPSKVFKDIGGNLMLGFAEGIADMSSAPQRAMDSVVDEVLNSANIGRAIGANISSSTIINNDNRTSISMSPSYQNIQSPASIGSDVRAALALSRR